MPSVTFCEAWSADQALQNSRLAKSRGYHLEETRRDLTLNDFDGRLLFSWHSTNDRLTGMDVRSYFTQNQLLFGSSGTTGILATELEDDQQVRLYRKVGGKVVSDLQPFHPVLWLENAELLKDFKGDLEIVPLAGSLTYRFLAVFNSWRDINAAKKYLTKATRQTPSDKGAPYLFFNDPIHQYLLTSGQTSFRELTFADLNRLQLDIETYSQAGFEFPNPQREQDRIIAIALSDSSGWETVLWGKEMSEPEMLERLNEIIQQRDPDIIEGHNIYKFDLNYIKIRAQRYGIPLKWGRNGGEPRVYNSRLLIAERVIDYPKWEIYGRHIVDTWILSQFYDITSRELESLSLKEMAKHFDLADEDRTYIEGSQISRIYDEDPDRLYRYALDDVRETRGLSQLLSAELLHPGPDFSLSLSEYSGARQRYQDQCSLHP